MNELQRVRKVINWLIYSEYADTEADLAKLLGYTKSSFSQIVNGKVPLSAKFIDKLSFIDENINKVWIATGNGCMFLKEQLYAQPTASVADETILYKMYKEKDSEASALKEEVGKLKERIRQLEGEPVTEKFTKKASSTQPSKAQGGAVASAGVPLK